MRGWCVRKPKLNARVGDQSGRSVAGAFLGRKTGHQHCPSIWAEQLSCGLDLPLGDCRNRDRCNCWYRVFVLKERLDDKPQYQLHKYPVTCSPLELHPHHSPPDKSINSINPPLQSLSSHLVTLLPPLLQLTTLPRIRRGNRYPHSPSTPLHRSFLSSTSTHHVFL